MEKGVVAAAEWLGPAERPEREAWLAKVAREAWLEPAERLAWAAQVVLEGP